jgi:hypothetical protein
VIVLSTVKVRAALEKAPSVAAAAKSLGISRPLLRSLAYKYAFVSLFSECAARGATVAAPQHHVGFVDMTGKQLAGVLVLGLAQSIEGNARWRCRYLACNHEALYPGIRLRSVDKSG